MKFLLTLQNMLIGISLLLMGSIPVALQVFGLGFGFKGVLYMVSFGAVFLVMIIRPLADITGWLWLRRLVILRKGLGILSSSIIVGLLLNTIITPESTYLSSLTTAAFYSFDNFVFFAHIGDISGLLLLITSNTFSQKLLKRNWKRLQRLSYVYFYAGGIYEAFALNNMFALYAVLLITNLTVLAYAVKVVRRSMQNEKSERVISLSPSYSR